MPGLHAQPAKLWPLFGRDLELAHQRLEELIQRETSVDGLCGLVPQLTYLGGYEQCERLLQQHGLLSHPLGRQSLFRVERWRGRRNPWRALIPAGDTKLLEDCRQQLEEPAVTLEVELVGGLGDILENHALIQNAFARRSALKRLQFRINNPTGWEAVGALLARYSRATVLGPGQAATSPRLAKWTSPLMRCVMAQAGMDETPVRTLPSGVEQDLPAGWVTNWRSKLDQRYPISSFSRSIPFAAVVELYAQILPELNRQGIRVHDVSEYNRHECAILQRLFPELDQARSRLNSLGDMLALVRRCQQVISVDTSLTHLCACSGRPVVLLLPLFADERWPRLMQEGCYAESVRILKQTAFHDWTSVLDQIRQASRLGQASTARPLAD